MMDQLTFGFMSDCKPSYREWPAGHWLSPCFTAQEYEARLERAGEHLPSVMGPARDIYRQGLAAARENLDRLAPGNEALKGGAIEWPPVTLSVESMQRAAFVDHCIFMVDGGWDSPGLEFKVRYAPHFTRVGMYCCETGSMVVTTWQDGRIGVDYSVGRDPFFLPGFRERQRVIYAPHFEHLILDGDGERAGLRDVMTDVPFFSVDGRDYVIADFVNPHDCKLVQAWSFCPVEEWQGPRYSYSDQTKAWHTGRTERGDRRGLVVRVRGQTVVLDAAVLMVAPDRHSHRQLAGV